MDNQENPSQGPSGEPNQPPLNAPSNNQNNNMVMGVLAYLGVLVIIPYLINKDSSFVKFHVKQGLVLFGIEVIVWVLGYMVAPFWILLRIVNLGVLVLSIIGIVNVVQGKEKVLPLVGKFAQNLHV